MPPLTAQEQLFEDLLYGRIPADEVHNYWPRLDASDRFTLMARNGVIAKYMVRHHASELDGHGVAGLLANNQTGPRQTCWPISPISAQQLIDGAKVGISKFSTLQYVSDLRDFIDNYSAALDYLPREQRRDRIDELLDVVPDRDHNFNVSRRKADLISAWLDSGDLSPEQEHKWAGLMVKAPVDNRSHAEQALIQRLAARAKSPEIHQLLYDNRERLGLDLVKLARNPHIVPEMAASLMASEPMLGYSLVNNPAVPPSIVHQIVSSADPKSGIYDHALDHPAIGLDTLRHIAKVRPDLPRSKKYQAAMARIDPDLAQTSFVHVSHGTNKLRQIRDLIRASGKADMSPKELPPGDWSAGRLPNGNISADKLQAAIDAAPRTKFGWTKTTWSGLQRHSNAESKVFQLNLSGDLVNKMKDAGVWETYQAMVEASKRSSHPVGPVGIGWVRYTGDRKNGIHIDEVQSDMGQSFVKQAKNQAAQLGVDVNEAERRAQELYPEEHYQKIKEIVFQGKHPSALLHEAFHEFLRNGGGGKASYVGTPIHVFQPESKAVISGLAADKPLPGHFHVGYKDVPVKMGFSPGKYGDLKTQSNPEIKGTANTWKDIVRKAEDSDEIINSLMGRTVIETGDLPAIQAHFGADPEAERALAAAKFLTDKEPDQEVYQVALKLRDDDKVRAALLSVGLDDNDKNLQAIQAVLELGEFGSDIQKDEVEVADVQPLTPEANDVAEVIRNASQAGMIEDIKLRGKHSKGARVARDPETRVTWLIKPGSGKPSPAAGVRDDDSPQSAREAAFWGCCEAVGLGQYYPRCVLLSVNGEQVAAMRFLGGTWESLDERNRRVDQAAVEVLRPYLDNGDVHRMAVMDWVLGNADSHGQNVLVNAADDQIALIDHGSAFAGPNFNPGLDSKSYIAYYIRVFAGRGFGSLSPEEKARKMPVLSGPHDVALKNWVRKIEPATLVGVMTRHGIGMVAQKAVLSRLADLRRYEGENLSQHLVELWCGVAAVQY